MRKIIYPLFSLLLWLPTKAVNAQVTITTGYNAQQLAQSLVGQGVVMLNAQMAGQCPLSGTDAGAGKFNFNGNPSDIGIDSGIVLTSGNAADISNPASFFSSGTFPGGATGDADLNSVLSASGSSATTKDACVLEFDFVPAGDTIKFNYVFGSEEYPEYACTGFNDVFAFFISGPGLSTGLNNIALVPNTNIPVAINTINIGPGSAGGTLSNCTSMGTGSPFSQYYVDNQAMGGQYIAYDGFTTVLTATSAVIPCDTYHLKLAIADAGDQAYDSGVFLKAGSLNSVAVTVDAETTQGGNDPFDAHCIRGCKPGKFKFTRPGAGPKPLTIHYLLGGTAQNNVDFNYIPDSIVIPAFQDSAILNIYGKILPTAVGPKLLKLSVLSPYSCGNGAPNIVDSSSITIYDSLFVKIPTAQTTTCPNTEVTITGQIDPSLNYSWSPDALIPDPRPLGLTIHPKPVVPTTYTLTVTMPGAPASCPPSKASFLANVEAIPRVILPSKDTTVCLADSMILNAFVIPENAGYQIQWTPSTYLQDNYSIKNKFFAPVGTYSYQVVATSPIAHCSSSSDMTIHVAKPFTFDWVAPTDTTIHYGDKIQLNSQSVATNWIWSPVTALSDPNIKDPIADPKESIVYTLIGIDQYGCKDTALVNVNVDYVPQYGMPNAFSPNGDGLNDYFLPNNIRYEKILTFKIFNRWGQLVYDGKNPRRGWDGTIDGKPAPVDTYNYLIELVLPLGKHTTLRGTVTLVR